MAGKKPQVSITYTEAVVSGGTRTYNEAGVTYNEAGLTYGGADNRSSTAPKNSSADIV